MAKIHDRVIELALTMNAAADTVAVTAVNYYRDRAQLDASNPIVLSSTPTSAQTSPAEISLGELLPPPTHIRLTFANF
jgi:hypothetical protein